MNMNRLRRIRRSMSAQAAAGAEDDRADDEGIPVAVVAELIEDEDNSDSEEEENSEESSLLLQDEVAVQLPNAAEDDVPVLGFAQLRGRSIASISSYLFDMVRQECTCKSILAARDFGCDRVVEHCSLNPEEAYYVGHGGRLPLHEACLRGSCSHVVQSLLLANGVGAMERDYRGNTPLHLLFVDFSNRNIIDPQDIDVIVRTLLEIAPQVLASSSNLEGSTPLHIACTTPETMIAPNSLVQLIAANPSSGARINSRNQTALRLHCQRLNASVEVARILYDANPDAILILDGEDGWAPIHYAAANANLELIRFLVRRKPEAARLRTSGGLTALHLLCRQNPTEAELPAMDILLHADPSSLIQRDFSSQSTPLHLLCQGSRISLQVVTWLVEANSTVTAIPDHDHYLPLHHASEIGADAEIISALLEHHPAAAKIFTRKQDSALSLACTCNKSLETVRLLIQAYPDALVKKNDYGFAPLHCVCRAYQPRMAIVQALLDACPSSISLKTHAGETPVHLACSNSGAFVGVLQLLTLVQNRKSGKADNSKDLILPNKSIINKIGNTPCKYNSLNVRRTNKAISNVPPLFQSLQCMMPVSVDRPSSTSRHLLWQTLSGFMFVTMVASRLSRYFARTVVSTRGSLLPFLVLGALRHFRLSIRLEIHRCTLQ